MCKMHTAKCKIYWLDAHGALIYVSFNYAIQLVQDEFPWVASYIL